MRDRFETDELKIYAETHRSEENFRAEEVSRSEELFRSQEFSSKPSSAARKNVRRNKNLQRQRSLLAGLVSTVGAAAGAVVIAVAVILSVTSLSLSSVLATSHSLQFNLVIDWAENTKLTAVLTSENERYTQTFSNKSSASDETSDYALFFGSLTPDTDYHLKITEGSTVHLSGNYRTAAIQLITPTTESVLSDCISLAFDGSTLKGSYRVYLDDEEFTTFDASLPSLSLDGLTPETEYRVTIRDDAGDTVFDKTFTTLPYPTTVSEISSEISMTRIRVELNVENAKVPLTASFGGQSKTLENGITVFELTELTPDTDYVLEISDGETIYFTNTYRTRAYEQKLFPSESVLSESIELQFTADELTAAGYSVQLNGEEFTTFDASQPDLLLDGLIPETEYRVTIRDDAGDTVFDKTFTTLPYPTTVSEISSEISMTRIRVELNVENAKVPLTASFGGQSKTLENGVTVLELTNLHPSTTYAVNVSDGETNYFFQTYGTLPYEQTLFPVEQYVGIDSILLQFNSEDLNEEGYEVYFENELSGRLSINEPNLSFRNLIPNTSYHLKIMDSKGNLLLDESYAIPYLIAQVSSIYCTPTSISLTVFIESQGQATVLLTDAGIEVGRKVLSSEDVGDILFDGLTPMTDYTLTIMDDRGTVHYEEILRTELDPELISISGTALSLDFPQWQFEGVEGTAELFLNGSATGILLPSEETLVTLNDLTPQTTYTMSAVANNVTWWQDSFTTPDIIINSAEPIVGSTNLNVTFDLQNPQNVTLRVALRMGDMDIETRTFTSTNGLMSFTASFETIENGQYVIRLLRESDSLILWQTTVATAYSFLQIVGLPIVSETEDGNELFEISGTDLESVQFLLNENTEYFISSEITLECVATDGSGNLTPYISSSRSVTTSCHFLMSEIKIGTVYELRLYRTVNDASYLIERLYWKCV